MEATGGFVETFGFFNKKLCFSLEDPQLGPPKTQWNPRPSHKIELKSLKRPWLLPHKTPGFSLGKSHGFFPSHRCSTGFFPTEHRRKPGRLELSTQQALPQLLHGTAIHEAQETGLFDRPAFFPKRFGLFQKGAFSVRPVFSPNGLAFFVTCAFSVPKRFGLFVTSVFFSERVSLRVRFFQ